MKSKNLYDLFLRRLVMKNICLALLIVMSAVSVGYSEKFTIAVLPDTQYYTRSSSYVTQPASINIFKGMTQFIANNKTAMNIVFVAHMGDVVNDRSNYTSQWTYAVEAMTTLKNANIPMGMCAGNHDHDTWTDYGDYTVASGSTYWNNYFGASTSFFSGKSWYGGAYTNAFDNSGMTSWQTFTAGGINFLHIALELYPRDEALAWASNVIAAHPGYSVIVSTHAYLHDSTNTEPKYQSSSWRTGYAPNNAQEIWDKFIKVNPQIIMVLSGHECYSNYLLEKNNSGGNVLQILTDLQDVSSGSGMGTGGGWMRFIEFDTTAKMIHVRTYSSLLGKYSTDPSLTDGSTYARTNAPFNYADGSDSDSDKGDGFLLAMSNPGSADFYIAMDVNTAYQGSHIHGLYKTVQIAPEYGYWAVGGLTFDPASTSIDGNYNKIYWCNRVNPDGWQGIYEVDIYNEMYNEWPLALGSIDQPYDITVNPTSGTYYVCNSISARVYSVANLGTSSFSVVKMLDGYDYDGDDDPVSIDMVPTGFGGGYAEGTDIVLFDNGVNVNEDEAIFILYSTSVYTSENYALLWEDGTDTSNNDIRGATNNVDGFAYFARVEMPSDVIGTSSKCYINRIKGDGVLQRVFMSVNGETLASSNLDDAIAINPVDGSVWLVVSNYGGNSSIRGFYRVDVANATLISGSDYIATTTLEFMGEYNVGVNSMAFSPDGKLLAVGCPTSPNKIYIYSTEAIDTTPVNCSDALAKGYKLGGDLNSDCAVDFKDLNLLVGQWLNCVVPGDAGCSQPWE
jgi:hypothetical protein